MNSKVSSWFAEARLGMFYTFSLAASAEDYQNAIGKSFRKQDYLKLQKKFKARRFDADEWLDCAAGMGARYIVPTAKYIAGFCLWDSQVTELKSTNTPCGRDLIGELAQAAAKKGIRFGFYFNIETGLTDGNDTWNRAGLSYPDYIEAQLKELLTNYGPIALVWFDGGHPELTFERMQKILCRIKTLQPDCLVNNRGVNPRDPAAFIGDFVTPERMIPERQPGCRLLIECCDAMGLYSWGFHAQERFWSTCELAKRVSLCAARGYNYLLNVEPAPDGSIRRECRERARGLGRWLERNRPALAAAPCGLQPRDPHELHEPALGVATISGSTLYLHLHQWPAADEISVPASVQPLSAKLLPGGPRSGLEVAAEAPGLRVRGLPPVPPAGPAPWIVAVECAAAPTAPAAPANPALDFAAGESVFLAPAAAELGSVTGLLLQRINRFANGAVSIGNLRKLGDTLAWRVNAPAAGEFEVLASFGSIACQANAGFELACGASKISGRTWLTEHYSLPVRKPIGRLRLEKGENRIVLRVTEMPNGTFSDVHGLTLIPAPAAAKTS